MIHEITHTYYCIRCKDPHILGELADDGSTEINCEFCGGYVAEYSAWLDYVDCVNDQLEVG